MNSRGTRKFYPYMTFIQIDKISLFSMTHMNGKLLWFVTPMIDLAD